MHKKMAAIIHFKEEQSLHDDKTMCDLGEQSARLLA
jgi:hypothetical protein